MAIQNPLCAKIEHQVIRHSQWQSGSDPAIREKVQGGTNAWRQGLFSLSGGCGHQLRLSDKTV
jgi:hypothetical protein